MEDTRIGLSVYQYDDKRGLMAYLLREDIPSILNRWIWVLAVLYFVACLFFSIYISTRLMIQLRRSVNRLEECAKQIKRGNFQFDIEEANQKDELKPLADAFRAMQKQLREEQDQKARYLMAISHDLKTPPLPL